MAGSEEHDREGEREDSNGQQRERDDGCDLSQGAIGGHRASQGVEGDLQRRGERALFGRDEDGGAKTDVKRGRRDEAPRGRDWWWGRSLHGKGEREPDHFGRTCT